MRGASSIVGAYNRLRPSSLNSCSSLTIRIFRRGLAQGASTVTMEAVDTTSRLERLRELMKKAKVDIYGIAISVVSCRSMPWLTPPVVVPSEDSHQSEYIAGCDARRGQSDQHSRMETLLTPSRVHLWLLWLGGHRSCDFEDGRSSHRRKVLQSSPEAARFELDALEARSTGRSDLARMV